MTIGTPAELENALSLRLFDPVVRFVATLPVTLPLLVFVLRVTLAFTLSAPPRALLSWESSITAAASGSRGCCAVAPGAFAAVAAAGAAGAAAGASGAVTAGASGAVAAGAVAAVTVAAAAFGAGGGLCVIGESACKVGVPRRPHAATNNAIGLLAFILLASIRTSPKPGGARRRAPPPSIFRIAARVATRRDRKYPVVLTYPLPGWPAR